MRRQTSGANPRVRGCVWVILFLLAPSPGRFIGFFYAFRLVNAAKHKTSNVNWKSFVCETECVISWSVYHFFLLLFVFVFSFFDPSAAVDLTGAEKMRVFFKSLDFICRRVKLPLNVFLAKLFACWIVCALPCKIFHFLVKTRHMWQRRYPISHINMNINLSIWMAKNIWALSIELCNLCLVLITHCLEWS